MRVRNPKRLSIDHRCQCEHIHHFTKRYDPVLRRDVKVKRIAHRYLKVPADGGWAMFVGHVCKACEESCMRTWIVDEHVCGEGDCHRGPV